MAGSLLEFRSWDRGASGIWLIGGDCYIHTVPCVWVGGIRFSEYQIKVHPSQINQRVEVHDKICSHIKKKRKENDKFKLAKGKLWVYKGKSKIIIFKRGIKRDKQPLGRSAAGAAACLTQETNKIQFTLRPCGISNKQSRACRRRSVSASLGPTILTTLPPSKWQCPLTLLLLLTGRPFHDRQETTPAGPSATSASSSRGISTIGATAASRLPIITRDANSADLLPARRQFVRIPDCVPLGAASPVHVPIAFVRNQLESDKTK